MADKKQLTPEEVRRKWDELLLVINNVVHRRLDPFLAGPPRATGLE